MVSNPRTILQKNIFFEPMQVLYNLINNSVPDINSVRADYSDARSRQWVFPTTPEANDENYPRLALIPEVILFEEYGAGRYLQTDSKTDGTVMKEKFGRVAVVPVTIGVFCKKDQKHKATYFDGTDHTIQNSKQSDFLGYLISNKIEHLRTTYFIPKNMDIQVKEISTSYEDNDFLWAKSINCEIHIYDVWTEDYSEADIIRNISMDIATI